MFKICKTISIIQFNLKYDIRVFKYSTLPSICIYVFCLIFIVKLIFFYVYIIYAIIDLSKFSQNQNLNPQCCLHTTSNKFKVILGPPADGGANGLRGGGFDKSTNTGLSSGSASGSSGGGNGSNNKDKNFLCPNCGNVCTQIEEFLCMLNMVFLNSSYYIYRIFFKFF